MVQERRGLLRVWNLSLVIATFSLTILGTFLTRSGVDRVGPRLLATPTSAPLLLGFFGVVVATGVGLIAWRGDRLRSPGRHRLRRSAGKGRSCSTTCSSCAFAFVVLLGTVFPLLYEALGDQQVTVGAPYFDAMTLPIGLALLVLMAIGPALPWRKATAGRCATASSSPAWSGVARGRGLRRRRGPGPRRRSLAFGLGGVRGVRQRPPARPLGAGARTGTGSAPGGGSWAGPTAAWWCTSAWW